MRGLSAEWPTITGLSRIPETLAFRRTWTPPLCQAIGSFWRAGMDCTRTFGLLRETGSLSLMGFAGRLPIEGAHSECFA